MGDARRLDDAQVAELVPSGAHASAAALSTPSGEWADCTQMEGDVLIIVDVASVTGSGTLTLQAQTSAANTGASATNHPDPRGSALAITEAGLYAMALDRAINPSQFLGLTATLSGITAAQMSAVMVGRLRDWASGAAI